MTVIDIKQAIIILYSMIQISHKDSLKFILYDRDECDGSVNYSILYEFRDETNGKRYIPNSKTGICWLPDTGTYDLYYTNISFPLTYKFKGQLTDTLNLPELDLRFPGIDFSKDWPKWTFCNKVVNGKFTDYYKSNLKRVVGKFRKGKLVGKLIFYDLDGKVVNVKPGKTS